MTSRTKKILTIISAILVLLFVGLLIYYFFFKEELQPTSPAGMEEIPLVEETAPEIKSKLLALTEETALSAGLTEEGKIIYVYWDGSINKIDSNGGIPEKIGILPSENISEFVFSRNGDKLSARQTLSSGGNKFVLFDAESNEVKTLPANTESVSFSRDGKQIVLSVFESGISKILLADAKTLKTQNLTTLKIPDLVLDWTSKEIIALKTRPSGLAYGLLYTLDPKTKRTQRLMGNIYGLTSLFSPSGKKILYSQTSDDGRGLRIKAVNITKSTEQNLDIFTLPEKCVWAQDDRTIYCGLINTENEYIMPDDYYKRKIEISRPYDIIKINLDTGETKKLISGRLDATNLFLSPGEDFLFFINKIDGRLYRLET